MPEPAWSGSESSLSPSPSPSPPPSRPPPKQHQPSSPPTRRQSIANRLLGPFGQGRRGKERPRERENSKQASTSPPVKRRSSTNAPPAPDKSSPLGRVRTWLDTCNAEHNHHCNGGDDNPAIATTWRPEYLVDSVERCLVKAKPGDRYLALSYVWGSANPRRGGLNSQLQLLKSNLVEFQSSIPEDDIPETILDTMYLARKLGLRFLWVDRLCIIQDDNDNKENAIRHMAYIYSNAYLTIVAAYGDAYTGLWPINPRRVGRDRESKSSNKDHNELLRTSRWNTRGWTLQELLYSRRAVFIFQDTVTWECHCNLWQKGTNNLMPKLRGNRENCTHRLYSAAFGFQHAPWPDLDEYARIAADYSARRVTFVEDTLKAFSGITFTLSRVFTDGFMYGMPLMFLDIALLWRPQASIRRRAPPRPPFLPSWSWMGWWFDGVPVDLVLWKAAADYVEDTNSSKGGQVSKRFRPPHPFRIKPTVTWSLSDRNSTVAVRSTGMQHRDFRSRKMSGASLPTGWSKSGSFFKHESDETTLFKYPVPVLDAPKGGQYEPALAELAFPGPLLTFKTTAGFFDVDLCDTMAPKDKPNPHIAIGNIWSRSNKWIGEFRAHDGWLGIQTSNYDGAEKLEFIAISTAQERKGSYIFTPERFQENMDESGTVSFVNVLWIERIGGVAYRRGIGHILLKAWQSQAKDEVDIVLG